MDIQHGKKPLAELKTQFEKFKVNYEYQLIMSNTSFLNCFFLNFNVEWKQFIRSTLIK